MPEIHHGGERTIMTLTNSLPARTARARSHYLGELIEILHCTHVEADHADQAAQRRLAEEAAQMACRVAFDARLLWNAAQERLYAAAKDDPPLREYVRGLLARALDLAEDALKAAPESGDPFVSLRNEAVRLRQELAAAGLPWGDSSALRPDPKMLEEARMDTERGDLIELEGWLRELQDSADESGR
jgi:hypothetical protein